MESAWKSVARRLRRRRGSWNKARPATRRAARLERLEPRTLLAGNSLLISELMASNRDSLRDGSVPPDTPDWIEIHNPTDQTVELAGWHLTDKINNKTKWTFPETVLEAGAYLVVFASGNDAPDAAGNLHTSFQLDADGEYLALVEPDGETIAFEIAPEFPPQFSDISYGLAASATSSTLLADGAPARAFVPTDDAQGLDWTQVGFDDSAWKAGTTGVGFETETGFEDDIGLDLEAEMHDVNSSAYLRVPFRVDDLSAVDRLSLNIQYDDGFVAYLNGEEVASGNARPTGESPDEGLVSYWDFDGNLDDQAARFANNSGVANDDFFVRAGGAARYVPGISGQALSLGSVGGEARSLAAASTFDTQLGPVYTIEIWIYPTALDTWGRLVLNWSGGQSYHFALRNDSRLSLFHNEAGGPNRNIDSDLGVVRLGSVAGWQHVVGVADGSRLRIYHDGQQVGSAPYDGTIQTLATGLGLGDTATGGSGTGLRYQGYVDDLAIWNVALTPEQIRSHFEAGGEGIGLDEIGADTDLTFDASATRDRPDAEALLPESIDITARRDLLQIGDNVLAIQGLNSSAGDADFLIVPEMEAATLSLDVDVRRYFSDPTPGGPNGTGSDDLGPAINEVTENPTPPADGDDLVITAAVRETNHAISSVELHYRVMFAAEVAVRMFDDGLHGDGEAEDDIYGAPIPAAASRPGEMVRWFVTAGDRQSNDSRWPLFADATGSPEYFGTVVVDSELVSDLPVLHRFVESPSAAETGSGTRASVFYAGEFYDNVFLRIRGGTSRSWPKKSYKIKFNEGHHFRFDADQSRVDEINVNTTYTDKSYVRAQLVYEVQRDAGLPSSEVFPIRMEQNGEFFSVALFVEQPDKDFLRRYDLDTNGALYKGGPGSKYDSGTGTFAKQTRLDEDKSDLQTFINGLAQSGAALERFLFDNVDLPGQINFMATTALTQNIDASDKNHYVYRDTEGSGEWRMLPWDQDLTFGPDALNTDRIVVDQNSSGNRNAVHPFLGGRDFGLSGGKYNDFLDRIFDNPRTRKMFLRRLRTLSDEFLGTTYFQDRIDELVALLGPDVLLDKARWGGNSHFGGTDFTLVAANERIKNEFLALKYPYLTVFHNNGGVGIPDAQPPNVTLQLGAFDYNPASGNQDEEYIEIRNPHAFSVDVSNWQITGGVQHTLPPGTVIGAGDSIYVTPNAAAFRARTSGPSGGQDLFVVDGYRGHLSSRGEALQLFDPTGREVDSFSYEGQPSQAQQFLRISELMFHPADDETGHDGDDFEYIELVNAGPAPLDLAGVHFTSGVQFTFANVTLAPSQRLVLVKNTAAFADRYDTAGMIVAGPFTSGTLDNGGESVKLEDAENGTILEFRYDNNWYPIAAGVGFSISVSDVTADFDTWGDPAIWRPSSAAHGSPGVADTFVVDMVSVPAPRAVVINEILAHSDEAPGDWIELHNTTNAPIDISGWFLSDDKIDPLKYEIPSGTIIDADGFATFTESQHFGGLFALSELGDDVVLQAVCDGALIGFHGREDFGANGNGATLGRTIKSTGGKDFVAMQSATFGEANSEPLVGPVVIHEILYNPGPDGSSDSGTDGGSEFIELMNISGAPVFLEDWHFDAIDYTFGPGAMIQPGELIVVVPTDPEAYRVAHNLPPDVVFGPYTDKLDNDGESLRLNKPGDPEGEFIPSIMVDRVSYNDAAPWPVEANGTGVALQRITPEAYGNEPQNWGVSLPGGTPGDFFTLPTVNEVLVSASDWPPAMLARLSAAGLGEGGFSIPAGEDQLQTIAWTGIDRISIRFSEHVVITSDDLQIAGVNASNYNIIDFQYDGPTEVVTTSTATWTLDWPVRADKLLIELSGDVRDNSDFPLDGNWIDATSAFPSGNGVIDSDDVFQFRFNVSPGDVTGDDLVDRADLIDLIHHLGEQSASADSLRRDLTDDGRVDVDDLRAALLRMGSRLPSGQPGAIGSATPQVAVDVVFERLGGARAAGARLDATGAFSARSDTSDSFRRRPAGRRPSVRDLDGSSDGCFSPTSAPRRVDDVKTAKTLVRRCAADP